MGIKGLFPFLAEHAPLSIKHTKLEAMTSRTIAIDASMCLHQFLVAVRQGDAQVNLSNEAGEVTSHIQGFLNRTLKLLESGLRPIYVFDGSPPELKRGTLAARAEQKVAAEAEYSAALRAGDANDIRKASHRISRATPQMNEDVQELLRIIGCPVILAPSEAEASCAALCKAGVAWATATEDMDALTFGTPRMLKNLFDTESARSGTKKPVYEISLPAALEQLDLSMESFVDFCVLCGCDYCGTLRGVGPTTAFRLLKQHGTPAKVAEATAASKRPPEDSWKLPEDWRPDEARALFLKPEVIRTDGLKVKSHRLDLRTPQPPTLSSCYTLPP